MGGTQEQATDTPPVRGRAAPRSCHRADCSHHCAETAPGSVLSNVAAFFVCSIAHPSLCPSHLFRTRRHARQMFASRTPRYSRSSRATCRPQRGHADGCGIFAAFSRLDSSCAACRQLGHFCVYGKGFSIQVSDAMSGYTTASIRLIRCTVTVIARGKPW